MATPFISEIRLFSFNFAPKGWAFCNGALLSIVQNQALFALIGTIYGGDGRTTFALPDLRGRAALHSGNGSTQGQVAGVENLTLTINELPQHNHLFNANSGAGTAFLPSGNNEVLAANSAGDSFYGPPDQLQPLTMSSVASYGGSQAHNNMQPYLALNYCIAVSGAFPSRS